MVCAAEKYIEEEGRGGDHDGELEGGIVGCTMPTPLG
jgi:hypothetical protein